jgi:hypothetical protein
VSAVGFCDGVYCGAGDWGMRVLRGHTAKYVGDGLGGLEEQAFGRAESGSLSGIWNEQDAIVSVSFDQSFYYSLLL